MSFYENIKKRRKEIGMTQEQLASAIGKKSKTSISKIESGETDINQSTLVAIAKALRVTPSSLLEESQDFSEFIENIIPIKKKTLPLLGSVACGEPIWAEQNWEGNIATDADMDADFCLVAKGDSMINARIYDGDVVFIKQQSMVENGQIGVVLVDNEATLKRIYYDQSNNIIQLVAENPSFPPLVYTNQDLENIRILGKAIAFQSKLN